MTQCIGSWRTLERGRMLEKALQRSNCTTRWSTRGSCLSVSPTSHPRKSLSRWSQSQQAVYCATIANWMKMKHSKTSWQLIDRPMRKQLAFSVVTTMTMTLVVMMIIDGKRKSFHLIIWDRFCKDDLIWFERSLPLALWHLAFSMKMKKLEDVD